MSFTLQFKTVLKKNLVMAWRNKDIIKENILPLFAGILLLLVKYLSQLQFMAPLLIPLAISGSSRSTLIQLVEEKAERYKETQKIMGLQQKAYITAWITSSYLRGIFSSITFLVIPCLGGLAFVDNQGPFIGAYFIYYIAAIHQSLCLSTLFSKTKMASEIGTILTIIPIFLVFLILVDDIRSFQGYYWILGLFPQCTIAFAYMTSLNSGSNFYRTPPVSDYYSVYNAMAELIMNVFLYLILYFYLDQIIPNEYGVSKHPLFFIKDLFKKKQNQVQESQDDGRALIQPLNGNDQSDVEDARVSYRNHDTSSADFHEPYPNERNLAATVLIRGLEKRFGDFTAVNKISIKLYESNIFCLLGHNGAGKTTTISLLTGLLSKTSGNVEMYGNNLETDMDEIRKYIGLCTQRDCLYDDLTFVEHLRFIGNIKGLEGEELESQVNYILDKTNTHGDAHKKSKELSGGQKRKLSLGMALIGGSKVIFLDEPTSGMDNLSRRAIWDILESVRNEKRTLVLTTHHLDEAEVLADRIGIMAKGKFLAVGSSQFIKKNFGEGYSLRISVEDKHQQEFTNSWKKQIMDIIESTLNDCQNNPQTQADTILYLIPFSQQPKFIDLFRKLKQFTHVNIDLVMNSLEDAFINIGMDEERFLERNKNRLSGLGTDKKEATTKNEYTNFSDIAVPDCLKNPPTYSFISQLFAIFLRRYYYTIRNTTNWISFVIAFILLVSATIVVNVISIPSKMTGFEDQFRLSFMSNFLVLAYTFNSAIFISLPVLEREYNLKYALNVMGCRVVPYWLGTFLFDYLIFFLTILFFLILCLAQSLHYVEVKFWQIFFILITFGAAYITSSYFWGFLFKKASAALKFFPLMNFFLIYAVPWILTGPIYQVYKNTYISLDTYNIINGFAQIPSFLISPLFGLQFAFIAVYPQPNTPSSPSLGTTINTVYGFCLILLGSALGFMLLTLYIEQKKYGLKNTGFKETEEDILGQINEAGDDLVKEEAARVDQNNNETIRVNGLIKKYETGTLAVKNTKFCIDKGEIFGLLGPNGAGKSTTFSILTSLIPKTYGSLKIKGYEVDKGIMEIYQDVGICPQFDCLWENLTPPEHLKLFGRMKGLKGKDLDESVEYFLKTMQLTEMVKKKAGQLSGGNKRKLCVANALIGGPDVQFFDEPSTGVDPIARRFLWNTLTMGMKLRNSAICMTTHTMDEAESLCTKIGILIKGQFQTLGTPQQLRNKYGSGYNITFKLNKSATKEEILQIIQRSFPKVFLIVDKRSDYSTYQIGKEEFKFLEAFELCENTLKKQNLVDDFSINQSSLEQVYSQFSRFQLEENDEQPPIQIGNSTEE